MDSVTTRHKLAVLRRPDSLVSVRVFRTGAMGTIVTIVRPTGSIRPAQLRSIGSFETEPTNQNRRAPTELVDTIQQDEVINPRRHFAATLLSIGIDAFPYGDRLSGTSARR